MFENINNWLERRRNERIRGRKLKGHPGIVDTSALSRPPFERTGIALKIAGLELIKNTEIDEYFLSTYQEQGFGQWYSLSSVDKNIAEAIQQFPEMLHNYKNTGNWITPNTDSIEHPARVNTKLLGSVGSDLFARLDGIGIADHANATQVMKDPVSKQLWLAVTKTDDGVQWNDLTSLDEQTSRLILANPKEMLSHYIKFREWLSVVHR